MVPSATLTLCEEDIVKLALEFLEKRSLHLSQLSLERESGVINGSFGLVTIELLMIYFSFVLFDCY